jgi:DNA helicase-2/ATP-dependent DNA helicase PcrA
MIVAPAGFGKTHAIAECLKHSEGRQLILTHTHAGVAALKLKIQKAGIANTKYRVETISSFSQRYVKAFYSGNDVPGQDENDKYFPFIIMKARELVALAPIKDVLKTSYSGLIVDEYQDCTIGQHELIIELSNTIPTHILGDPLQGIFGFKEPLVDLNRDLKDFDRFPDLDTPWRWKDINPGLGECIKVIRRKLENREQVDLEEYEAQIEVIVGGYNKRIWELINDKNEKSVLIIHPNSEKRGDREKIVTYFRYAIHLVEAIDDKDFYGRAKKLDNLNQTDALYEELFTFLKGKKVVKQIKERRHTRRASTLLTGLGEYFPEDNNLPKSSDPNVISIVEQIKTYQQTKSHLLMSHIFKRIKSLKHVNCCRVELFNDLCKALEQAEYKGVTVFEAMKEIRNSVRKIGRRIIGRCIGTTLLTKGLEFDTVAILNAHEFKCHKNFYVAISRACKKLIIFTENKKLSLIYK